MTLNILAAEEAAINSAVQSGLTSDSVLATLRDGLTSLDSTVEVSKKRVDKVRRPVLFGEQGSERVAYEVDAYHEDLGIVVEIEAGRGAMSNAVYRDLVRSSLIVGARYLTLGVMPSTDRESRRHRAIARPRISSKLSTRADDCSSRSTAYCSSATSASSRGPRL